MLRLLFIVSTVMGCAPMVAIATGYVAPTVLAFTWMVTGAVGFGGLAWLSIIEDVHEDVHP